MKEWTIEDAETYQRKEFEERLAIRMEKSHDYASADDILGNFKRVSKICELLNIDVRTPVGYALLMVVLKLDRICNLVFGNKKPKNESVQDSFRDLKNYIDLAEEILIALGKLVIQ